MRQEDSPPLIGQTAKRRPRRLAGIDLRSRFCLIVFAFNQNPKAKPENEQPKQAQARNETMHMAATASTNAP